MNADDLRNLLTQRQVRFTEKNLKNGVQFRCTSGEIFNAYDTGTVLCQGTRTPLAETVAQTTQLQTLSGATAAAEPDRQIFIVYGHDTPARDNLELLLHRMGFAPIVLQNLPAAGDTIIEKLEHYLGEHGNVGFVCVLLTPDDQGHKAGRPEEIKYRARQNVVLELGMVLARLGRRRVAILHKGSVELPSDIAGLLYIPFAERVDEVRTQLFRELKQAGFNPRSDAL